MIRENTIKEITEALNQASDKVLAVIYTIVMLTTEFDEKKIDLSAEQQNKEKIEDKPKRQRRAKKDKEEPEKITEDYFDEPLEEDFIKDAHDKNDSEVEIPVKDDFDDYSNNSSNKEDDFDEDFNENQSNKNEDDFDDDFDEDFNDKGQNNSSKDFADNKKAEDKKAENSFSDFDDFDDFD